MRVLPVSALLLALAAAAPALAQGDPDAGNPLAKPSVFVGSFTDGRVRLTLAGGPQVFEGTIHVDGQDYPARCAATNATNVSGTFRAGDREYRFSANHDAARDLVTLYSANASYVLKRDAAATTTTTTTRRAPEKAAGLDLRPGQRFHFELRNAGTAMTMIYEVREVRPRFVRYGITTIMDMGQGPAPVGPATVVEWQTPEPAPVAPEMAAPDPRVEMRRERVVISGVELDCLVVRSGNTQTWVPMEGPDSNVPAFPGLVKTMTDGSTVMELVKIEAPPEKR